MGRNGYQVVTGDGTLKVFAAELHEDGVYTPDKYDRELYLRLGLTNAAAGLNNGVIPLLKLIYESLQESAPPQGTSNYRIQGSNALKKLVTIDVAGYRRAIVHLSLGGLGSAFTQFEIRAELTPNFIPVTRARVSADYTTNRGLGKMVIDCSHDMTALPTGTNNAWLVLDVEAVISISLWAAGGTTVDNRDVIDIDVSRQ